MFKPPWIRDSCFATPFQKGVEYSQVSLSHNKNNSETLCTRAYALDVICRSKDTKKKKRFRSAANQNTERGMHVNSVCELQLLKLQRQKETLSSY